LIALFFFVREAVFRGMTSTKPTFGGRVKRYFQEKTTKRRVLLSLLFFFILSGGAHTVKRG
jgi:hypothetical protein